MWSAFRIENEQLNNTLGYRRIAAVPLHFDAGRGSESEGAEGADGAARARRRRRWRLGLMALEIGGCMAVVAVVYIVAYVSRN